MTRWKSLMLPFVVGVVVSIIWIKVSPVPGANLDKPSAAARNRPSQIVDDFHTESSCGSVSLSVALKWLRDDDISIADCNAALGNSVTGIASASDLERAAMSLGFRATTVKTSNKLTNLGNVVLICHVHNDHWLTVVPKGRNSLVIDPPRKIAIVSNGLEGWDGVAVAISRTDSELAEFLKANKIHQEEN